MSATGIKNNSSLNWGKQHARQIKTRVALDIDGVLCDFVSSIYKKAIEMALVTPEEVFNNRHNYAFLDIVQALYQALLDERSFWLDLPPQETNINFIPSAYVSAREIPLEWTQQWLHKHGFPVAPVYHTRGKCKVELLSDLGIETMVEDCPEHYFRINKAGIPTYLYTQPYNLHVEAEAHRIDNLSKLMVP